MTLHTWKQETLKACGRDPAIKEQSLVKILLIGKAGQLSIDILRNNTVHDI